MNTLRCSLLVTLLLALGGCASSTPVRPAPLSIERRHDLAQALVGEWKWVAKQSPGGEKKEMPTQLLFSEVPWNFTFGPNGTMKFNNAEATWSLEGANIVTNTSFETLRAEEWNERELKLYWYGDSTYMYLVRR